jgi:hypothetical protein
LIYTTRQTNLQLTDTMLGAPFWMGRSGGGQAVMTAAAECYGRLFW